MFIAYNLFSVKIRVQQSMNFVIFHEAIYRYINCGINIHCMSRDVWKSQIQDRRDYRDFCLVS